MQLHRRDLLTNGAAAVAIGLARHRIDTAITTPQWSDATKLINSYVAESRYAGVAVAVSSGRSQPSFLTAGSLAFGSKVHVTPDSIFRLYSVTKVFTALLTLRMVEHGLLRLDQPLGDIFPEFRQMNVALNPTQNLSARPATQPITIKQLLTHTSGLSNWQPFLGNNPISEAYRAHGLTPGSYGIHKQRPGYGTQVHGLEALVFGLAQLPLIAEPGAAWNYSIGYDVLGAVIERVTGKPFATVMKERILDPLEMASTDFQVPPPQAFRFTTLYGRTGDETYVIDEGQTSDFLRAPTLVAGGGGLLSTARDMARFAEMLLENGRFRGLSLAKAETIDQAISLFSLQKDFVKTEPAGSAGSRMAPSSATSPSQIVLSAVGASSTLLHVDQARRLFAIFLAQLNRTGSPSEATTYRNELLSAIDADQLS